MVKAELVSAKSESNQHKDKSRELQSQTASLGSELERCQKSLTASEVHLHTAICCLSITRPAAAMQHVRGVMCS